VSTLVIELSEEVAARLAAASAAGRVQPAQWAREAVEKALPAAGKLPSAVDAKGWPVGHFERYAGCLAGDDWRPPVDPPPEPVREP